MKVIIRKVIFAVLALAIIGFIGKAYADLNGNPIKLWLVRGKIEHYLSSTYPNTQFTYQSSHYSFKTNAYGGRVTAHTVPPVSFYVTQSRNNSFRDDFLANKLGAQSTDIIADVVKTVVPNANVSASVGWDNAALDVNEHTTYTKGLDVYVSLDVRWEGEELGKEEFLATSKTIREVLAREGYSHISSFFFSYKAHEESLVLSLNLDELHLPVDALLSRISHFHGDKGTITVQPFYTQSMRLSIQAQEELKVLISTVMPDAYYKTNVSWDREAVYIPEEANYNKNLEVKVMLFINWLKDGEYDEDYFISKVTSLVNLLQEEGYHHISQMELLCEFAGKRNTALLYLTEEEITAPAETLRSHIIRDRYR